jgi:hypothetical protein
MNHLNTQANFTDADTFYAALTDTHRELTESQSEQLNARLILLLANHIGNNEVLTEALNLATRIDLD